SPCSTSLSPNAVELFVFLAGWSLSPLTLVVCLGGAFSAIHRLAPILADILCRLGRHSLMVFSVGSLLVAIARILDDRFAETAILPVAATIVDLATLLFTASSRSGKIRKRSSADDRDRHSIEATWSTLPQACSATRLASSGREARHPASQTSGRRSASPKCRVLAASSPPEASRIERRARRLRA